jgi:hypothetical protein
LGQLLLYVAPARLQGALEGFLPRAHPSPVLRLEGGQVDAGVVVGPATAEQGAPVHVEALEPVLLQLIHHGDAEPVDERAVRRYVLLGWGVPEDEDVALVLLEGDRAPVSLGLPVGAERAVLAVGAVSTHGQSLSALAKTPRQYTSSLRRAD